MRADAGLSREQARQRREDLVARARVLRADGKTWAEVGAEVGVSRSAIRHLVGPGAPTPKPPASSPRPLAEQAIELQEQGLSLWTISRQLGVPYRDVERAVAAAKLREQVASGRLRIRQATPAEMEEFRRQRERHDRQQIRDRGRALGVA